MFTFFTENNLISQINEDLELGTLLLTNYLLLPAKLINRLMKGLKLEEFS